MIWVAVYFLLLAITASVFYAKGWCQITYEPLTKQKVFWASIFIPAFSFFYFGYFSWSEYFIDMSSDGLNRFVKISTFPLGLLSLSIPLAAIVTSIHRSIQTASQISLANIQVDLANKKNSLDELFSREKNFVEKCKLIEKKVGFFDIKLKNGNSRLAFDISTPHMLFHKLYNTAPINGNIYYDFTDFFSSTLLLQLSTIESNIAFRYSHLESGSNIDDGSSILYVIMKALCTTLDLLSIPVCQVPYFYIQGEQANFQLCISSEDELKMMLKKYLIMLEALADAVGFSGKYSSLYTRRYVFQGVYIFPSFKNGNIIHDHVCVDWVTTVNPFKGSH